MEDSRNDRPRSRAQRKRIQAEKDLNSKLRLESAQVSAELAIMELRTAVMARELELKRKTVEDLKAKLADVKAAKKNRHF